MEQTTEKVQASSKDMAQRTLSSAEQNIRASLDYAERLVRAKDLQETAQIQSDFVRTQTEAMQAQMKEFGSATQSAMDTAKGVAQSAAEAMKAVAQRCTAMEVGRPPPQGRRGARARPPRPRAGRQWPSKAADRE